MNPIEAQVNAKTVIPFVFKSSFNLLIDYAIFFASILSIVIFTFALAFTLLDNAFFDCIVD